MQICTYLCSCSAHILQWTIATTRTAMDTVAVRTDPISGPSRVYVLTTGKDKHVTNRIVLMTRASIMAFAGKCGVSDGLAGWRVGSYVRVAALAQLYFRHVISVQSFDQVKCLYCSIPEQNCNICRIFNIVCT